MCLESEQESMVCEVMSGESKEKVEERVSFILEMLRHKTQVRVVLSYVKSFLLYVHHV